MFDEEEEDNGFFLLVLGVLAAILLIVVVVAINDDELPDATVTGPPAEEVVEEAAAPETTAAPTTTAAPATTVPPPPPAPEPFTLWDALNDTPDNSQFAAIGGPLGLQDALEADGPLTVLAPSNAALDAFGGENIGALAADPDAAAAVVGYHFIPGELSAADIIALDGQTVTTTTGQPIRIDLDDSGTLFLNGLTQTVTTDIEADNGVLHVIDMVLMPPSNINEAIGLQNIEFEVASAALTAAGQDELQLAVAFFTDNPGVNAIIEGHTDTDGTVEGNLDLSQRRAEAVEQFLIDNGIDGDRLTPQGFGEAEPILDDGVEDQAASRRIEFVVQ